MITVQKVLAAKAFQDSEVLAGEKGLSRDISTITVAEVPDSANWLRGGELVCSTAFFISNTVVHQNLWIESLIHNGASALAIKTSRFLGTVPSTIIDVANKHNFPIIGLPHEITWPVVIESFMDFFMNERMKIMQIVEEVQSSLINLVLENKGIQSITENIANLVGNTVILEDARLNTIAIGHVDSDEDSNQLEQSILKQRLNEEFRNGILQSDFYKNVQRGNKNETLSINISSDKDSKLNFMIPLFSNESIYGFISLLELKKAHTSTDLIVLENSTTAIALQLMKQYLNQQTFHKKTLALIDDLIHGRFHTQALFEHDFTHINWSHPMIAVLVDFSESYRDDHLWDRSEELISTIIKNHLKTSFDQAIIGSNGSLFTILVSFPPTQLHNVTTPLKNCLEQALSELEQRFGKDKFYIGVGGVYPDLKLVGRSFKEANNALSIVKKFKRKGAMLFFKDIGIHRILSMVHNTEDLRDFCDDFLSELKKNDSESENVLLETLHVYLLSDCGIKETAQKMFLHPNTVAYRIKKIKKLIKHDLDSPEFKMAYLFALECNTLLE